MPAARRVNGTNCCPAGVATGELPRGSNEELLTCAVSPKCIQICYENGLIMHFANVFLQSLDDVQIAHHKRVPCSTVCNCGQALRTNTAPKLLPSLPANVFFLCLSGVAKHLIITHDRSKHDSTNSLPSRNACTNQRTHMRDASVYAASVQQHAWLTGRNIPIYYIFIIYLYVLYLYIYIYMYNIFILCSSLFLSQLSNSEAQNPQNLIPSHSFSLGHRHRAVAPRRKDMDLPRAHLLRIVPAEVGRPHRQALWCPWRRRQGQQGEAEEVCGANGRS